jgi:Spx/MgsR family transcriptional regulator
MITLYGIANCDTVRKARAFLEGRGVSYSFHDYKKAGADPAMIGRWVEQLGWDALLNRGGTTFRKLDAVEKANIDDAKAVQLMAADPSMIRRPVIDADGTLLVGFKASMYEDAGIG